MSFWWGFSLAPLWQKSAVEILMFSADRISFSTEHIHHVSHRFLSPSLRGSQWGRALLVCTHRSLVLIGPPSFHAVSLTVIYRWCVEFTYRKASHGSLGPQKPLKYVTFDEACAREFPTLLKIKWHGFRGKQMLIVPTKHNCESLSTSDSFTEVAELLPLTYW